MYTDRVVKVRSFACILALVLAATPVLGLVCQLDCDQLPKSVACHESANSSDHLSVRSAPHPCDHDHTGGSPALAASASGFRESVGIAMVGLSIPALAHATVSDVRTAIADVHGPPGLIASRLSALITVLRI
jgi:hypothetical protein